MKLFPTDFEGFDICEFCYYSSFVEITFPLKKKKSSVNSRREKTDFPQYDVGHCTALSFFFIVLTSFLYQIGCAVTQLNVTGGS